MKVSKEIQNNIDKLEEMTFSGLKDFQKKTVKRVASLFENDQNRVLVADEVGMGKTMIAKGVIAKMAQIRINEGDDLFKVVYICSNQAIAKQNIKTLNIVSMLSQYADDDITDTSDTRLSMQHLKITQQESDPKLREKYIQIIPLTPGTSFEMAQGCGSIRERALMYAVMSRVKELKKDADYLRRIFVLDARTSGFQRLDEYDGIVEETSKKSGGTYPQNIIDSLKQYSIKVDEKEIPILEFTKDVIEHRKKKNCRKTSNCYKCEKYKICKKLISELRIIFAKISTENLNPDLVIMDEFQRFNSLIDINNNDDSGILARRFLQENPDDITRKTRVLLLSATPYKLYTTMEEMDNNTDDDPYKEFFNVMDFLFEKDKESFRKTWLEYSASLQTARKNGFDVLKKQKANAEEAMYKGACRTERISVMDDGDYIDDSSKDRHLEISEGDIKSYIQMQTIARECASKNNVPTDYIKSCPYLMSFMDKYKLKDSIRQKCIDGADTSVLKQSMVWLDKKAIDSYEKIPANNARLELLMQESFKDNAEKLLWVPPTRPYYELEGVYKGINNFSKILIFSAWEMVPRMISTLISYEEERKVRDWKISNKKTYFQYKHGARLKLEIEKLGGKQLFSEIYPSQYLANLYNPVKELNNGLSIAGIKVKLKNSIETELQKLKVFEGDGDANDWYIGSLLLMDDEKHVASWFEMINSSLQDIDDDDSDDDEQIMSEFDYTDTKVTKKEQKESDIRYKKCIANVIKLFESKKLGEQPADLADFLVNVAMGSFSTCYYRSCSKYKNAAFNATEFGRAFIRNFNTPEFMEVLDYVDQTDDIDDTKNYLSLVYKYCINGCFQGMLDEYIHLLQRNDDGLFQKDLINNLDMLQTSHYEIDTIEAFSTEIINGQIKRNAKKNEEPKLQEYRSKRINMRSHYAVCFSKTADKNEGERKENLRNAFNSPLRPFVLASTSIGQEGLDFHNYCRKIMHWNLPSNPIDLEQREGRINRYKCLAIRQNVAVKYGSEKFSKNLWTELFEYAKAGERRKNQSELVPFWCFGKNQTIKIERIVPMYPMSSDINRYERLIKILSLYRMTLGQPRQEELLEYIFSNFDENEQKQMKELFIDLSPWSKKINGE